MRHLRGWLLLPLAVLAAVAVMLWVLQLGAPPAARPGLLAERDGSEGRRGAVAVAPATPPATRKGAGSSRSAGSYPVNWHRRYRREHRHVHRLLAMIAELRHVRRVQAHEPTAALPEHYQQWLCIHQHEGAWDANTGNGYFGGLQMDMEFQRDYGPELLAAKGTADNWSPLEQMMVAERAYQSGRGFWPWPNTARMCGLL